MTDANLLQSYRSIQPLPSEEDKIEKFLNSRNPIGNNFQLLRSFQLESFLKVLKSIEKYKNPAIFGFNDVNDTSYAFNRFRVGEDRDVIDYYGVLRDMLIEANVLHAEKLPLKFYLEFYTNDEIIPFPDLPSEVAHAEELPLEFSKSDKIPLPDLFSELLNKIQHHIDEIKTQYRVQEFWSNSEKNNDTLSSDLREIADHILHNRNISDITPFLNMLVDEDDNSEILSLLEKMKDIHENQDYSSNPKINSLIELYKKVIKVVEEFSDPLYYENLDFFFEGNYINNFFLNCFKNRCYIIPYTYNNTLYYRYSRAYSYATNGNNFVVTTVPYFENRIK